MHRDILWQKLTNVCGLKEPFTFENRIFNAVMLLVAATGMATVVLNLVIGNHVLQIIISLLCALVPILCFLYSIVCRQYKKLIVPTVVFFESVLVVGWFVTGGINGSVPYYFFILIIYSVVFLDHPFRVAVPLVSLSVVLLSIIDFSCPELIINYDNGKQKYIDVCFSIFLCLIITSAIIFVIFREYKNERNNKDLMLDQAIRDREIIDNAMREIKVLKGLLPICSHCKKIRDDQGSWRQLEEYILAHSEAQFSHSLCSKCAKQLYPDFTSDNLDRIHPGSPCLP